VREVFLWGSSAADLKVDIRHTMGRKLDAIVQHKSQIPADHPRILRARGRHQEGRPFYEYFRHLRISL